HVLRKKEKKMESFPHSKQRISVGNLKLKLKSNFDNLPHGRYQEKRKYGTKMTENTVHKANKIPTIYHLNAFQN
ncbi:hypothetical protein BaRGS_00026565, partial [Batillaria attramentaria]